MATPGMPVVASGNATILIYLSLFLQMLVFFIVLNTHSVPRDYRVHAVLESVERSFADRSGSETSLLQGTAATLARTGLQHLGDLMEADLSVVKLESVKSGRLLVVQLLADDLFEPNTSVVRREHIGLIDRIARELGDHEGVRFAADFLIAIGDTPAGQDHSGNWVARAAAMAAALQADGVPADAISVGLEPGPTGTARFLFSAHTGGARDTP